ncbi:unnamed protein product [Rhizoctonia solani]|uniref:Uncharacterized protein n=1 Tax=Rhizoctonia solani TaxID=456999 RepID=A0A8H3AD53_9AGAM|nr:unnamed protein product [Rhizoctonia solani]
MANPTLDYRLILDMHPKSKTIDPGLRSEAVKVLRMIFSGMYPKVRLVYHCPAASISRSEHIYVVFDRFYTRQQFCRRRKIHNPLRTVYTYNGGPVTVQDYILQTIEGLLEQGEVIFSGPLFDQIQHERSYKDDEDAEGIEEIYNAFLDQVPPELSREGGEDDAQGPPSSIDPEPTQS